MCACPTRNVPTNHRTLPCYILQLTSIGVDSFRPVTASSYKCYCRWCAVPLLGELPNTPSCDELRGSKVCSDEKNNNFNPPESTIS